MFAFAEAFAADRRPRSATGSGSAGACTTDIVPHSCTGVRPGLSQGVSQVIGEICLTIGGFDQVDGSGLT